RAVPVPAVLPERTAHAGGAPSATTSAARPPSQDARHLRTLDLTGRDKQLREAMGIMHRVAQNFCRAARRTLPFLVWRKAHLVPRSVAISAAPGRSQGAEGPSLHAIYHESAGTAWATVSLNAVSLALILEGALGASESRGSFTFGKELTLAQRAL